MNRTPFGTPFHHRPECFPDQTRPDQSCSTAVCGVFEIGIHPSLRSVRAEETTMDGRSAAFIGGSKLLVFREHVGRWAVVRGAVDGEDFDYPDDWVAEGVDTWDRAMQIACESVGIRWTPCQ